MPLFVRSPGQAAGAIDPRRAETIDIVPTVADVLGVSLPAGWDLPGSSLREDAAPDDRTRHWVTGADVEATYRFDPDPLDMARDLAALLGPPRSATTSTPSGPAPP